MADEAKTPEAAPQTAAPGGQQVQVPIDDKLMETL